VKLSKADKMYKDCIDCASDSEDPELAEDILRFFVSVHDKECFCATLFTCYKLIKPDVAMELAWRHGYVDFVMPYMIQFVKNLSDKVQVLDERTQTTQEPESDAQTLDPAYGMGGMQPMLAIAPTAYNNDPSAQYGMGMAPGMNMGMGMQPGMGMAPGMQQNPYASSQSSMGSNPYGNSGYQY